MENADIKWTQRFDNYKRALLQLIDAVKLSEERELSLLEKQGTIQAFEYTHELAWNTIKDFLSDRGNQEIYGSKDATREAFQYGLIDQGEIWMDMIKSRNKTSHTYNNETALEIVRAILNEYHLEFVKFEKTFKKLTLKEQK